MRDFPVVSLTRATFRLAELGFLGFAMMSWVTTPFLWGHPSNKGDLTLFCFLGILFALIDWFIVRNAVAEAWKERFCRIKATGPSCGYRVDLARHEARFKGTLRAAAHSADNIFVWKGREEASCNARPVSAA